MIIGVTGLARSGKGSVAATLVEMHGFEERSFAADLKAAIGTLNCIVGYEPTEDGWTEVRVLDAIDRVGADEAKTAYPEVRRLYQVMGTEVGRAWSPTFWIDRTLQDHEGKNIVISDLRFPNEGEAIRALGGIVVKVTRPGVTSMLNGHASETSVDTVVYDVWFENNGTLEDLDGDVSDWYNDMLSRIPVVR